MTKEEAIKVLKTQSCTDCYSADDAYYCPDRECPVREATHMAIAALESTRWIPVSERPPECEQEVMICTKKAVVTSAIYEDGTIPEVDSEWHWEDIDYAGWNEEEDCGIIPEGWWENRHFNPDDVYNNPVDQEVVAWMPLPEPYQEDK